MTCNRKNQSAVGLILPIICVRRNEAVPRKHQAPVRPFNRQPANQCLATACRDAETDIRYLHQLWQRTVMEGNPHTYQAKEK